MQADGYKVPKRLADIMPVRRVYDDGIFRCAGFFTKTWQFSDINYSATSQDDKRAAFLHYSDFLNLQEAGCMAKISIVNRLLNRETFENTMLMPMQNDENDRFRRESNRLLMETAMTSNNAIVRSKYITLSVQKKNIDEARSYFARKASEMQTQLNILGSFLTDLDAKERLRIFHDIFRVGHEAEYGDV